MQKRGGLNCFETYANDEGMTAKMGTGHEGVGRKSVGHEGVEDKGVGHEGVGHKGETFLKWCKRGRYLKFELFVTHRVRGLSNA